LDHAFREINADSVTRRPDAFNGWKEAGTPTSGNIEHALPRLDPDDLHETTPEVDEQSLPIEICCPAIEAGCRLGLAGQGIVAHGCSS